MLSTVKILYNSDTQRICCNHPKIFTRWPYHIVIGPKDVDKMANSVDPDQTAPLGSVLFAQTCLSENFGRLWYSAQFLKLYFANK